MKETLARFSAMLLIGLLLVKVSALHVYEHHDSPDGSKGHCELCVMTIKGQQLESLTLPITIVQYAPLSIPSRPEIASVVEDYVNTIEKGIPFLRPPPHILA